MKLYRAFSIAANENRRVSATAQHHQPWSIQTAIYIWWWNSCDARTPIFIPESSDAHEPREYFLLMMIITDRGEHFSAAHIVRTIAAVAKPSHPHRHTQIHFHSMEEAEVE